MTTYRFIFDIFGTRFIDCITCESLINAESLEEAKARFNLATIKTETRIIQIEIVE